VSRGPVAAGAAAVILAPLIIIVMLLGIGGASPPGSAAQAGTPVGMQAGQVAGGAAAAVNESLGASLAAAYGWTGTKTNCQPGQQQPCELSCLDWLWTRESGWNATAINSSSGAYGIAQALGHAPGASVELNRQGDNYPPPDTAGNPAPWGSSDPAAQISWGLGYIASSYGSPCQAWAHETADGFY
jgi:hypothetical protein